jgi:predicted HNH restriction endonuclease
MSTIQYNEKPTYRSEIISSLRTLGGQATLSDIYKVIEKRNILPAVKTNPNWKANVRWQLQNDSSDSNAKTKSGKDLFYSVEGIKGGIWGIRDFSVLNTDDTYDFIANGEFQNEILVEGSQKTIAVNIYERNKTLRRECIDIYGLNCVICEFNFADKYGFRGNGFIEVHHLVPLSAIRQSYIANPKDLRPVCSNCHSIIHRFKPFLTIDEMNDLIFISRNA